MGGFSPLRQISVVDSAVVLNTVLRSYDGPNMPSVAEPTLGNGLRDKLQDRSQLSASLLKSISKRLLIDHIRILGIGLELACN